MIKKFVKMLLNFLFSSFSQMISLFIFLIGIGVYILSKVKELRETRVQRDLEEELRKYLQEEGKEE